jgi:fructoselysine-6-P-deglycase FrlB-like protein
VVVGVSASGRTPFALAALGAARHRGARTVLVACHAGASANFASFDPHANRHDPARSPLYYWAARFMEILLLGVFAFFGVHTVFWFYRELREKFARGGNGKEKH